MLNPVRTTAGWLAGRVLLFLAILVALVAWDAYRDESTLLSAQLKGLVPDKELVARLEAVRAELDRYAADAEERVNQRLRESPQRGAREIDRRLSALEAEIAAREQRRLSPIRKTVALMTGEGIQEDLKNEIEIQLLIAEREALRSIKGQLEAIQSQLAGAASDFERARVRTLATWEAYRRKDAELKRFLEANRFWVRVPMSDEWVRAADLRRQVNERARQYNEVGKQFFRARDRLRDARASRPGDVQRVQAASAAILEPLDQLIATKQSAIDSAARQAERIQRSAQRVFLQAIVILIVISATPIGIKALWYVLVAPLVERRPPIRLRPWATAGASDAAKAVAQPRGREKISAVSQDIRLGEREELLVHPDFLQSTAHRGSKATKWLLDWRYPFTSIAAGMVALTRIRTATPETYVVSSRNDPLAEVGLVQVQDGGALVLQPRNLVGLVQTIGRPIRIRRRWVFTLSAWITLQFRYLVFEGPGTLIVQGCRGVRTESAGTGRAIDQNATMGFSANLAYAPKRSETFGAYLTGASGLFNDSFTGAPGFFVYEEMPYAGKRTGITGRGLEGLTDGLLKVVGI